MTMSSAISRALSAAEDARTWRASTGHVYQLHPIQISTRPKGQASNGGTLGAEAPAKRVPATQRNDELSLERAAEEAFLLHMRHGGEYIDENPITGRPGEFHLSSTGRKAVPPPQVDADSAMGAMNGPPQLNTKFGDNEKNKTERSPKSATMPKPKRVRSKMSNGPTPAQTPTSS